MLNELNKWILDHQVLVLIVLVSSVLIAAVIAHLMDRNSKGKTAATTAPSTKSKKGSIIGVIVPICILGGVVYGLYWLWAKFMKGASLDMSWLKYVVYALLVIITLSLMRKLGFFKWLSAWNAKRKANAIKAAATAAASGGKPATASSSTSTGKTKESFLKSWYFWIPLLIAGGLGYYFRDPIWNWGVDVISMPWWKEMMPLWITIGVLLILLLLFWMIGKDSFGKLLVRIIGLAAIVLAIWFVLNLWNGFVRMLPNSSSSSSASSGTARRSDVLSVIQITPQQPVQSLYLSDWSKVTEWTNGDERVTMFMPKDGELKYSPTGNLLVDPERCIVIQNGRPTLTNVSPGDRSGYRVYWTDQGGSATVTIKSN